METDQNKTTDQPKVNKSIGNNFWTLRSSHGRKAIFSDPKTMWDAACGYFQWCIDNPLIQIDFKGKDATEVKVPKMRAFTLIGLAHYLDVNEGYFNDFYNKVKGQKGKRAKDFSGVIAQIKESIRRQKFEGAASGFLDARIISLDLGMAQKQEVEHTGDAMTSFHITMDQIPKGQELPSDESQIDLTREVKK